MSQTVGLPLTFLARMAALLDEEFPQFLVALSQPPLAGLRVNTLKVSVEQFLALRLWDLTPVPWCETGFILPPTHAAGMHPLHDAGLYYLQEPSTMAVAKLLAPQPGERVIDLCAAPGGKATHLAALMQGQGLLVANEIDHRRAEVLAQNLERCAVRHAIVLNETPERLARRWPGAFDRVLVDAPCSGEGMFRKKEQARQHWSEAHVAGCAVRQRGILDWAAHLVRPGGRLVYATCTFAPEENEGVIWRFLKEHPDFELAEPSRYPGFTPGYPDWYDWPHSELQPPPADPGGDGLPTPALAGPALASPTVDLLRRTVRLWPHKANGEGHFIAVLERQGKAASLPWAVAEPVHLPRSYLAALAEFWETTMTGPLPERLVARSHGDATVEVYAVSLDTPDTGRLRTVRPGWHLGTLRTGSSQTRFTPSHALALGIASQACRAERRLDEALGSEAIARYLRGETLSAAGPDGWVLICLAGFGLGWGKRTGGVIKNHYPKMLRWATL